jgi:prepilin-type processing-associated H-X9-DG protein
MPTTRPCAKLIWQCTCPSEIKAKQLLNPESFSTLPPGITVSQVLYMSSTYRAMSGVSATGFDQWAGFPSEVKVNMNRNPGLRGILHTDWAEGVPPERFANVTDGTSNTIFVGERSTRSRPRRGTFWANTFNLYDMSGAYPQSASLLPDYDACGLIASDIAQCKYGWGSFHTGVINFVFGDGSVRPLKTRMDMIAFTHLATIGNGETTQEN